jgi:hypothetical protein
MPKPNSPRRSPPRSPRPPLDLARARLRFGPSAAQTRFDCTKQFKNEPWAQASYQTSALPAGALAAITPELTRVNASRIPGANPEPKIWTGDQQATVVTTDFFAFDDSTDFYKLQGFGRACDMGDSMVGHAMQDCPGVDWYAVRNASDPQIANPDGDIKAANHKAGQIYAEWGAFTTAASAIATWAMSTRGSITSEPATVSAVLQFPDANTDYQRF